MHCATCTCLSTKRLRNFYDFFHFLLLALAYMYLPSTLYVPSSEFSVFQDCPWAIFFLFIFKDNKAPWKWVGFVRWKWRNAQQGFHATLGSFNNHVEISLSFFDQLPTSTWTFLTLNVELVFFDPPIPPYLVHVVFKRPPTLEVATRTVPCRVCMHKKNKRKPFRLPPTTKCESIHNGLTSFLKSLSVFECTSVFIWGL